MFLYMLVGATVTEEGKEKKAEHVERGETRSDEADNPQQEKAVEGLAENFIFAEKSGERKNSGDRQGGDQHRCVGVLDLLVEAAHLANVLLSGHGVNHASCAEEQERLEEGMGHQVKNSGGEGADAEGKKHVAELADGRIGQNFFDVVLYQRHGGGKNRGNRADYGYDVQGQGRELVDCVHAHNH